MVTIVSHAVWLSSVTLTIILVLISIAVLVIAAAAVAATVLVVSPRAGSLVRRLLLQTLPQELTLGGFHSCLHYLV